MDDEDLVKLEALVREWVRDELALHNTPRQEAEDEPETAAELPRWASTGEVCGVPGRDGVCLKPPKHEQRHRYGPRLAPVVPPPARSWREVESYVPDGQVIALVYGSPVKVTGYGKRTEAHPDGAPGRGLVVTKLERNDDTGEVNVTVKHVTKPGHHRCFRAAQVEYDPPKRRRRG